MATKSFTVILPNLLSIGLRLYISGMPDIKKHGKLLFWAERPGSISCTFRYQTCEDEKRNWTMSLRIQGRNDVKVEHVSRYWRSFVDNTTPTNIDLLLVVKIYLLLLLLLLLLLHPFSYLGLSFSFMNSTQYKFPVFFFYI